MSSDSSGDLLKIIGGILGSLCTALVALAGIVRTIFFQASLVEIFSYVIAALFIFIIVILVWRKDGDSEIRKGEVVDGLIEETLAFSLPIYSRADRPSITPEFREKLNKNRKIETSEIKQYLRDGKRCLIITGVKGVGKSTLAAYFAEGDDFWLDFVGKTIDLKTLLIILAQWAGEKGFEGHLQQSKEVGEIEINQLCDKLTDFNRKLFFDNLETLLDKNTRQFKDNGVSLFFRKLLTTDHPCRVLITSRIMPVLEKEMELEDEEGVVKVKAGGLSDKDGAELLREEGVKETEESPLESISREVDGNPLLLRQLIPILRRPSVGGLLNKLKKWKEKYKGEILEAILKEEAPKAGRELIFRMSVVPDPLSVEQIQVLRKGKDTDDLVDDLESRSLLEWDEKRNLFSLHPAVKETAEGELERKPELLKSARRSALKMYMDAARGLKPREEWKSIEDCAPLVRSAEIILDLGEFENAAVLIVAILNEPLDRWGQWYVLDRFYEKIITEFEVLSKKTREKQDLFGQILNNYGSIRLSFGDCKNAIKYFENCLEIVREIENPQGEGAVYTNLGNAYFSLSNYGRAIEYYEKALKIAIEIEDHRGEGNAYGNLGNTYNFLGEYAKAIEFIKKSLKINLELKYKLGTVIDYGNLGNAYFLLGDFGKAIEFHEKSLKIALEISYRRGEGNTCCNLGNVYSKLEEHEKALEYFRKALLIQKEIDYALGMALSFGKIAEEELHFGRNSEAASNAVQGLLIAVDIRVPQSGWLASLAKKCREKLGVEEFRRVTIEAVGEEKAEEVERILAESEELQKNSQVGGESEE